MSLEGKGTPFVSASEVTAAMRVTIPPFSEGPSLGENLLAVNGEQFPVEGWSRCLTISRHSGPHPRLLKLTTLILVGLCPIPAGPERWRGSSWKA